MTPLWVAILLTLLGSTCMNMGLVLQKKGVSQLVLEPGPGRRGRLRRYFTSPIWCWGMFLLVLGYGLFMRACTAKAAPISVLQPIFAFGVVIVAVMAVIYLKERFGALEWFGVALLVVGVVLLGYSAEEGNRDEAQVYLPQLLLYTFGLGGLIGVAAFLISRPQHVVNVEFLYGVLAGVLLGIGYLNTRTFSLEIRAVVMGEWVHYDILALGLILLLVGLFGGLVVLQKGFRRGRALIITAVNLVVNQVIVVAGGMFCLGERFPRDPSHFKERVFGLGAILVGTVILARFGGGDNAVESARLENTEVAA